MSTLASIRIDTWGKKFVVVGEFGNMTQIPRQEFDNYSDALAEFAKIAQREVLRYDAGIDRRSHW